MIITFYGEGCFKIQSGDFVVSTDPFDDKTGLAIPRFKSDIVLKTLTPLPLSQELTSLPNYQLIYGSGEYNISAEGGSASDGKDINITGFGVPKESSEKFLKTVYLIKMEGINLCFLGHISETPEPAILEHLEEVDILFIPAGGEPFITQKSAMKTIKQIEPKIVIPSFYKIQSLKRPAANLSIFLEEFNGEKTKQKEAREKLVLKKKDLAGIKKTQVIILKP